MGGTFHFGLRVENVADVDAWIAHLAIAGVRVLVAPHMSGAVYVGRIADPDGVLRSRKLGKP